MEKSYSIIIPAYNEAQSIGEVLEAIRALKLDRVCEIIVVNDASTDETAEKVATFPSVSLITNVQNSGYGYSLKQGIKSARYEHIIITDADGTYPIAFIPKLITEYERGFDMVVGARQGEYYHGTSLKRIARFFFRQLSEFTTGRKIPDINSGFRIFRKNLAIDFFHTLSSGFSFTTTITLAFMLNAYSVMYFPIPYHERVGSSKVRYFRDTLRSLQFIVEAIVFYNPLKIFLLLILFLLGIGMVSFVIGYLFSIWTAIMLFLTTAFCLLLFAIGCVVVSFRFTHRHESTS